MKYTETEYGEVKKVLEYISTLIVDENSKENELYGIAMVNKAICMIETLEELDERMVDGVETLKKCYPKDMQYLILPVKDGKPLHETMTEEWKRNGEQLILDEWKGIPIEEVEFKGRYREGVGFNKWEPTEGREHE